MPVAPLTARDWPQSGEEPGHPPRRLARIWVPGGRARTCPASTPASGRAACASVDGRGTGPGRFLGQR
jgi:hypothetical protein